MTDLFDRITFASTRLLPLLARFTFAAVLLRYFWGSALTKLDGLFTPSLGAYAQIFPRQMEAAGYDASQLGVFHWLVVMGGTYAEFILPALIVVGLFTRLAALGMIGFTVVQSLTDIVGHKADAATIGAWFDRASDALIMDQRTLWVFVFVTLAAMGAGAFSMDSALKSRMTRRSYAPDSAA
ncbi:DoxX family protein [Celeribacter sp.]|uniref:DoxX family protein n=1 Tax=Celeribacter sp. TaxID=1890673 RepID=UPI003A95BAFA